MTFAPRRKQSIPAQATTTIATPQSNGLSMQEFYRKIFDDPRSALKAPSQTALPEDEMVRFYRELHTKPTHPAQQQTSQPGTRLAQMSGSMDTPAGTANAGGTTTPSSFPPMEEIDLPGFGRTQLDPETAKAVKKWMDLNTQKNININFTAGFRKTLEQERLHNNPRAITPAKPGTSLHEAGRAVDIDLNPITEAAIMQIILQNAHAAGLNWGGNFKKPDKVHFYQEVPGGRPKRQETIRRHQMEYKQWQEKQKQQ